MTLINIEAFLAILIFSFVPVAIKYTAANPFSIGLFRLVIATFFIGFWWNKKINWKDFKSKQAWRLPLIGIIFFAHWITYFFAIKIGGPESCVLGMSTYGIQLIIYGAVILNYKLKLKHYTSLLIVIIGLSQVLPSFDLKDNFTKGLALGLLSASFYSILPIIHQRSNQYFKHEIRIFSQFFFALILFSFFIPNTDWNLTKQDWYGLTFLAVFGTLIAHSLWAKVTSQMPTYMSGIIYYAITPSALFISHLVFKKSLSAKQLIGASLIITGAIYNIWSSYDSSRKT